MQHAKYKIKKNKKLFRSTHLILYFCTYVLWNSWTHLNVNSSSFKGPGQLLSNISKMHSTHTDLIRLTGKFTKLSIPH